jgi:hypothetical protein
VILAVVVCELALLAEKFWLVMPVLRLFAIVCMFVSHAEKKLEIATVYELELLREKYDWLISELSSSWSLSSSRANAAPWPVWETSAILRAAPRDASSTSCSSS